MKVGDSINPTHGIGAEGHKHEGFKVVGILKPTGTANDKAVFINIEGFYLLEGHALSPEEEAEHAEHAEHAAEQEALDVDLARAHRAAVGGVQDDLAVAGARMPADMVGVLEGGAASLAAARQAIEHVRSELRSDGGRAARFGLAFARSDVTLLAPVLRPSKVICLGLNYVPHATEVSGQIGRG